MYHLKEWAGMGALVLCFVLAFMVCAWCLCRMAQTRRRDLALVAHAIHAVEAGQFPQAWLAAIKQ